MYKLLLVTNRKDVREAFAQIPDMNRLMFDPLALAANAEEAIKFLNRPGADAIAIDLKEAESKKLHSHLDSHLPHLPIMRTHRRGDGLRNELTMLREALDQLHGDFSDCESNPELTLTRLQNEALHRLLEERLASHNELESRLLLARSPLNAKRPALLFEFELPDGANFLASRWSHGFDRLDLSLRANFFGKIEGPLVYAAALLSPLRLRVLACTTSDVTERELDLISAQAHELVLDTAAKVKAFMDLELVCTRFRVLESLADLIPPSQ